MLQVDVQLKLRVANGAARHAAFLCALLRAQLRVSSFGCGPTAMTRSARDPTHDAGMHTAMVYVMALSRLRKTDACIGHAHVLPYLEQVS